MALYDVSNNKIFLHQMSLVKDGKWNPYWQFLHKTKRGYWCDQWYYKGSLIYEEGYSIEYGQYAKDFTTSTLWVTEEFYDEDQDFSEEQIIITNEPFAFNDNNIRAL